MRTSFCWLIAGSALLGAPVASGGWSSSGGELLRDAHNPWFVENTREVSYCIAIDEQNFGIRRDDAATAFRQALDYWQRNFRLVEGHRRPVAAQTFVDNGACRDSDSYDLRIQLGVLNDEQKSFLNGGTHLVSILVRTDYDSATLRGRGFLYVTPETGPLKFDDADVPEKVWSKRDNLRKVLLHELGHLFGLPHDNQSIRYDNAGGDPSTPTLMAEDFPEFVLKNQLARQMLVVGDQLAASAHGRALARVMSASPLERAMGVDWPGRILVYDISRTPLGDLSHIDVGYAGRNPVSWNDADITWLGRIEDFRTTRADLKSKVNVYVPAQPSKNLTYTIERFAEGGTFYPISGTAAIPGINCSLEPGRLVLWRGANDGSESSTLNWQE